MASQPVDSSHISDDDLEFGTRTPYEVQRKTISFLANTPRGYCLNGLGTGKTFCTLAAFVTLQSCGRATRMLVVAPLSTLKFVWAAEVLRSFPNLKVNVLYGSREKRLKLLADMDADVYVVNHDGVSIIHGEVATRADINVIALDELAEYRNGGAGKTKDMRRLVTYKRYVWGLTGSPIPRSVCDVWGQCSIITPGTVPKYFNHLRNQLQYKAGPFEWRNRPGSVETAVAMMSPSVRYTLDDVTELPEVVTSYVPAELGAKQRVIYNAMRTKSIAMLGAGQKVDALNAGAALSKLLQIAMGWVYTREGETIQLDNHARIQAVVDLVDASANKVLVFVPYKSALQGISEALTKHKISHLVVSGDTPSGERNVTFDAFQNAPEPKVLLAHPGCLAHGLTLTAADTVIWAGPIPSYNMFQQACGRIRRIGQKNKQYIILIGGTYVEKKRYLHLGSNESNQNYFLELSQSEAE